MRRLLLQSDRTPTGQLERALLQSAVDLSDAIGDEALGYEARLRLSAWAAASGDSSTRLRAFDHCLERHLADPLRFPATVGDLDLLWDFASVPRMLAATPRYDRATIAGCLDEMLDVFSLQGADLRAFDFARFEVAAAMGEEALAAESLERVNGRSQGRRDPEAAEPLLCEACVQSAEIAWHTERGHLDRAAAAADRLRESGAACADEPELGLSRSLVPYLLTDRLADARDVHLDGYERVRRRPNQLEAVARHIEFAVMIGALQRALGLVERHACWLAADPLAASAHFSFLCAAGGAMDALTRAGRGATAVTPTDAHLLTAQLGSRVGAWTATTFARACWTGAIELAAAFDARNGTDRFARRLASARSIRPVTAWETSSWGRGAPDGRGIGSRSSTGRARPSAIGAGAASATAATEQRLAEPRVLLARAREQAAVGDRAGAESAIDDALPRADPETRADLFALRIRMHVEGGEISAAQHQLEQRIDCLIVDDLDDDAELDLQLGLLLFGAPLAGRETELEAALGRSGELGLSRSCRLRVALALATVFMLEQRFTDAEALLTEALTGVTDARRSAGLLVLADAHFALGHPDDAIAALDLLLRDPIDRVLRASALLRRASVLFTLDPERVADAIEAAIDDADRALALFAELDHCEGVLDACGVLGHLLGRVGSVEGSLEALRTAHRTAVRFEHPDADAMAFRLACALVRADQGEEARALLDDVAERTAADADPAVRGEVFYWLGHAYRQDDDDPAAYCIWSLALEDFGRSGDPRAAVRSGIALGRLLFDNDDPAAVPVLQQAARQARATVTDAEAQGDEDDLERRGVPAATLLIDSLHLLGRAQAAFGDPAALITFDDVIKEALAQHRLDPLLEASVVESRARALDDLDREGDAVELARESARLYDAAGDRSGAARLFVFGARLQARRGAAEEADALYRAALARYDEAAEGDSSTAESRLERALAAREQEALQGRLTRPVVPPPRAPEVLVLRSAESRWASPSAERESNPPASAR